MWRRLGWLILVGLVLFLPKLQAQTIYGQVGFDQGATLPGNCSPPSFFWNTSNTTMYVCVNGVGTAGKGTFQSTGSGGGSSMLKNTSNTATSAFTLDASAATGSNAFRLPTKSGVATTLNGTMGYDITLDMFKGGQGGGTSYIASFFTPPTGNGNCVKWIVAGFGAVYTLGDTGNPCPIILGSGQIDMNTSPVSAQSCATVVTVSIPGTVETSKIIWNASSSLNAVTGYAPTVNGGLTLAVYPSADNINFDQCNWSSSTITPGGITLNYEVIK